MPKKRRVYLGMHKNKKNNVPAAGDSEEQKDMSSARGRLKGALLDVLGPADDSDASEPTPIKREKLSNDNKKEDKERKIDTSIFRQSYVLKLFDRSVDLSQFFEDSPLYPICRAWIANQPKADYQKFGINNVTVNESQETITLPAPEGPLISRIPDLLPAQVARSKENIKLDYDEENLPTQEELLQNHMERWVSVRHAWLKKSMEVESRYQSTQEILDQITSKWKAADDVQSNY